MERRSGAGRSGAAGLRGCRWGPGRRLHRREGGRAGCWAGHGGGVLPGVTRTVHRPGLFCDARSVTLTKYWPRDSIGLHETGRRTDHPSSERGERLPGAGAWLESVVRPGRCGAGRPGTRKPHRYRSRIADADRCDADRRRVARSGPGGDRRRGGDPQRPVLGRKDRRPFRYGTRSGAHPPAGQQDSPPGDRRFLVGGEAGDAFRHLSRGGRHGAAGGKEQDPPHDRRERDSRPARRHHHRAGQLVRCVSLPAPGGGLRGVQGSHRLPEQDGAGQPGDRRRGGRGHHPTVVTGHGDDQADPGWSTCSHCRSSGRSGRATWPS